MPALTFLAMVGLALVALLFVADATLEPSSPLIVTSDRVGLPERWRADTGQTLTTAPAAARTAYRARPPASCGPTSARTPPGFA